MLHCNGLLLCLHLLVLLSLMGCLGLGHGSLMLWASWLSTHLLLLLKQVWGKVDEGTLSHLSIPHRLQLLCLRLIHVCHGVLETHAHATLLVSEHCLLLLSMHVCLLRGSLLYHCRVHHLMLLLLGKHVWLLRL